MARFSKFRSRARGYYNNRAVYYTKARNVNNKWFGITPEFLIGAGAGMFMPHNQLIDNVAVIGLAAPVKLGKAKQFAAGYVFVHAAKSILAGGVGNIGGTLSSSTVI